VLGRKCASLFLGSLVFCSSHLVERDAAASASVIRPVSSFQFEKNAAQYCLSKISAQSQSELFARTMNLGASYSHGCTQCDVGASFRDQLAATNDLFFVRRNYLAQFLERARWKNPAEFKFEFLNVQENDAETNLARMFPLSQLQTQGYNGKWAFYPEELRAELLSSELEKYTLESPGFNDQSMLIGSGYTRHTYWDRDLSRKGHIYQSVPGKHYSAGARQKILFDLALDKSRSFELLKNYGDEQVYKRLVESGWNDLNDRSFLISKTVAYLRSFGVSSVFAPDAMFWDAVPALFARAKELNPKSLVAKLLTAPFLSKQMGLEFYKADQRERMMRDYFEVLARLSRNNGNGKSVPVFYGRLIDAPGEMIRSRGLEKEFGALIAAFVEVFTGRDFSKQITDELKKRVWKFESKKLKSLWHWGSSSRFEQVENVEEDFSEVEAAQASRALKQIDLLTLPGDTKPVLPDAMRGLVNAAILSALGDLPLLVDAADAAFTDQNRILREVAANPHNNIQLLNVDEFFNNFHTIVNEYTMHPSVKGAGMMADLVEESLCASVGPNP
jgi:hypothetical protein